MRFAPLRLQARPVVVGQLQRGAIVDRRQPAPQQALALQGQLFRRLVAGIKPAIALQHFLRQVVAVEPVGLAGEAVPIQAEPAQIPLDPGGELRRRTFQIGIVQAQQETAVLRTGEQPVDQRQTDVTDMEHTGRTGSETDGDAHGARLMGMQCFPETRAGTDSTPRACVK